MVDTHPASCTDAACPSTVPHNEGYYNFTLSNDKFLSNKLPADVRAARERILESSCFNPCLQDWAFLMRFAVAHQSHRDWLMPKDITWLDGWDSPKIAEIRESANALPEYLSLPIKKTMTPVKKADVEARKIPVSVPTTGRRVGMGRGINMSKRNNFLLGPLVTCDGMVKGQEGHSSDGTSSR